MEEKFILRTVELHSSPGVVHIETIGYDSQEAMRIEFDAYALLEDIPSLYMMAKKAIEEDEAYQYKKFKKFNKLLAKDLNGCKKPEK